MEIRKLYVGYYYLLLSIMNLASASKSDSIIKVTIDINKKIKVLRPLWTSTGFSPEIPKTHAKEVNQLLNRDVLINLALIGSLPNKAIKQVRIHWLLDLMTGPFQIGELDNFVHNLWKYDLKPGFELMGNPGQFFQSNFTDPEENKIWQDNITYLIKYFIRKYGLKEVSQWNFETWNEPDHNINHNFTENTYKNYLNATINGLMQATSSTTSKLRFGGPGGSCRQPHFVEKCAIFLDFIRNNNRNLRSNFISFHRKGQADVDSIIDDEVQVTIPYILESLQMKNISLYNDEGDPQKSWWKPLSWRATVKYPALVARHIAKTQETVENLDLISNDNAFLNSMDNIDHPFEQRTMFTRFGDANVNPILVAKPIFHLWTLLSLQGEDQLNIHFSPKLSKDSTMIASKSSYGTIAILISQIQKQNLSRWIELNLNSNEVLEHHSSDINWLYRIYTLNDAYTNPQQSWKQNGKPFPNLSIEQIKDIRNGSKLHQSQIFKLEQQMVVTLKLPNTPNVVLVQYCSNESSGLEDQPYSVNFYAENPGNLIIFWKYPSQTWCLDTFLIEFSDTGHFNDFHVLTQTDSVNNFHILEEKRTGWYRIQARNFFGRCGPYSVPDYFNGINII